MWTEFPVYISLSLDSAILSYLVACINNVTCISKDPTAYLDNNTSTPHC